MEKLCKILSRALFTVIAAAAAGICGIYALLPSELSVEAGGNADVSWLGTELRSDSGGTGYYIGSVPIKQVELRQRERPMLVPCGTPFGIKLKTSGVMAVTVTEDSPAEAAGVREGDIIISVNGEQVSSNSALSSAIQLRPEECEIILRRGDSELMLTAVPYKDCGIYKIGLWVRDSAAGLGTMTYYDPVSKSCGGLGHPVSDVTTGELMPLGSGEMTAANITGAVKGYAGTPGELCGTLIADEPLGVLQRNTRCGIFGSAVSPPCDGEAIPMAFRQEVTTGDAVILATVEGCAPKEYDISIEHINLCDMESSKSMVIRITDKELLDKTGGIVCGMSGSPIIQNGRLVGAVTHVFLNDPERGYAVFCETMLDNAA